MPVLTRPLERALVRSLLDARWGAGAVAPSDPILALFSAGEQGAYYDIQDLSSMFQDAAGTTACAVDAVVGYVADKSGNGNHITQATTASKPYLRKDANGNYYLEFDGFDDSIARATIDLTGTDAVTVVTAFRKTSDSTFRLLFEHGNSSSGTGTFGVFASSGSSNVNTSARGTSGTSINLTGLASPITLIHTMQQDISSPLLRVRLNGGSWTTSTTTQGTGNLNNATYTIGRRGSSFPYMGNFYRQLVIGKQLSDADLDIGEPWANEPVLVLP